MPDTSCSVIPRGATPRPRGLARLGTVLALAMLSSAHGADRRPLWPDGAPLQQAGPDTETHPAFPTLDHYPASRWGTGAAVIICPGGGYGNLATTHEGSQVAAWFNELGVVAFVLRYRHAPAYHHPAPVLDVQRALRWVRSHAPEMGVNPTMIGIMGFSAGGHLAATASTQFDDGDLAAADPIDRASCRPDFAILCYPVISFTEPFMHQGSRTHFFGTATPPADLARQFSNEIQVTPRTPPTFIFQTDEDTSVPAENSVAYYLALRRAKVPAEFHVYQRGRHGGGLWIGDPSTGAWTRQLAPWLRGLGLLNWPATGWDPSPPLPPPAAPAAKP